MLDNSPPPTKRMKLQKKPYSHPNKENHDPNSIPMGGKIKGQDTRKRKVPIRRPIERNLVDLDDYAMLQVLDYLSLEDLCNLAQTNVRMRHLARRSILFRANNNGLRLNNAEMMLIPLLWIIFQGLFTTATIWTR